MHNLAPFNIEFCLPLLSPQNHIILILLQGFAICIPHLLKYLCIVLNFKILLKTINNTVTNTEPCGTSLQTQIHPDHLPLIHTRCLLSFNQSSITLSSFPLIPCFFNFSNHLLCGTLSDALAKSKNTISTS